MATEEKNIKDNVCAKAQLRLAVRQKTYGNGYEITVEECLNAIKRLSGLLGGYRPSASDINSRLGIQAGCPTAITVVHRFGSVAEALRVAGIDQLQTRQDAAKTECENQANEKLDKPFVISSELSRQQRKIARDKGIPIVYATKSQELNIAVGWMGGQEYEGILLSHDDIEKGMGDNAFRFLSFYCQGLSMAEIGRQAGLSRERVRQVLTRKAEELFSRTNFR